MIDYNIKKNEYLKKIEDEISGLISKTNPSSPNKYELTKYKDSYKYKSPIKQPKNEKPNESKKDKKNYSKTPNTKEETSSIANASMPESINDEYVEYNPQKIINKNLKRKFKKEKKKKYLPIPDSRLFDLANQYLTTDESLERFQYSLKKKNESLDDKSSMFSIIEEEKETNFSKNIKSSIQILI